MAGILAMLIGCTGEPDEPLPAPQDDSPRFGIRDTGGQAKAIEILKPRPGSNVLVVTFDALRADALGCYGNPRKISPNLDAFASEALLFEQAYTVSPVTATSFAAAWTGRVPTQVFHDWKLDDVTTLAEAFQAAGYATTAILNNAQLTPARQYNQGFDNYVWHLASEDDVILQIALEWLEKPKERPFFAWIHFLSPHAPYDWIESSKHLYDPRYEGRFARTTGEIFTADKPEETQHIRNLYDGEVLAIDRKFGQLIEALRAKKLLEQTIVVATADHGDEFGERGGFQHKYLYEETMRIPLMVRHPEHLRAARSSELVSNLDYYPTLLSLAGLKSADALDGIDLTQHRGDRGDLYGLAMTDDVYRGVSIRRGAFKLVLDLKPAYAEHLFDLRTDPLERNDLAPSQQEFVRLLSDEVWKSIGERGVLSPGNWTDFSAGLSPETVEALRSLGY